MQTFAMDFLPLILLFAISITGLALTVSQGVAARQFLRFPRHSACDHRDRGVALSSVRQVLPHFSAARPIGRETVPAGRAKRVKAQLCALR